MKGLLPIRPSTLSVITQTPEDTRDPMSPTTTTAGGLPPIYGTEQTPLSNINGKNIEISYVDGVSNRGDFS
jgi:hypothetical protein